MRISIAIATYNGAQYLQEQLDSFLCQTQLPDELVACDDGSADSTFEILQTFSQQAPFSVHVYRNEENLGYARNFEKALSLCTGDIILMSDQDDVWFESKIERIVNEFKVNEFAYVVVNDAEIVHADLKSTGLTLAGQLVSAGMDTEQLLLGCCISFRADLKKVIFPIPCHIHGHDGWINTLGNALHCRYFITDILQLYRRHGSNASSSPTTSTRASTRWHLLKEKINWSNIKQNPLRASSRRIQQLSILKTRVELYEKYLQNIFLDSIFIPDLISKINEELTANETRQFLQKKAFIRRLISGFGFYFSGGYRQFEGWKSLVRDIVR